MTAASDRKDLFEKLVQGDRIALSRAITLVESNQKDHIATANALLDACAAAPEKIAMRIAVSGPPGLAKAR